MDSKIHPEPQSGPVSPETCSNAFQYVRAKVNQLLMLMGTLPLRPEELDDSTLIELDPIGIIAGSFEQVLGHLKQTNHELNVARNEIRSVFDSMGAAVVVVNAKNMIEDCNSQALDWFFHTSDASQIIGRAPDVCVGNEQIWMTNQIGNRQVSEFPFENRFYQRVSSLIRNDEQEVEKVVHLCFDITVQKRAEEMFKTQAMTDTLTGIANRRKLYSVMTSEIGRAGRYHLPLSVMMLDIDHFKQVNDMLGHLVGDDVLVNLSSLVAGMIREQDVFARWGGEEFVILVPNRDLEAALQFAEKLKQAVEVHTFPAVGYLTCSFGVAEYQQGESIESIFKRVDAALYQAKQKGRNRIEVA